MDWIPVILIAITIGAGVAVVIAIVLLLCWLFDKAKHDKYIADLGRDEHERNKGR